MKLRQKLVSELKELKRFSAYTQGISTYSANSFKTNVTIGNGLKNIAKSVTGLQKRDCYGTLKKYLTGNTYGRVCLLYGLRRTGKTTLLFQAISDLSTSEMAHAALFSDVYAMMGMKIVLSGTDSLGYWFALDQELYDRTYTIHTTFIPFREHSRLLHTDSIDEYIRYGGTLRPGETAFDNVDVLDPKAAFRDDESTRKYIDTAICRNIQHSLTCCEGGGHFRHLQSLYHANELTNAINRIIEDMNHTFLIQTLTDTLKSHDLGSAAQILRKQDSTRILDHIDKHSVTSRLMELLDIRNKENLSVGITATHVAEIKEYLKALELIIDCPTETIHMGAEPLERVLFSQPGMRYCHAQALVFALVKDPMFASANKADKQLATNKILEDVCGRLMEEIILLETMKSLPKTRRVFKLLLDRGEFDMAIYDSTTNTCELYEIKHSKKIVPEQHRVLLDENRCQATEKRFGKIAKRCVLYCGTDCELDNGICYQNVESYLRSL